MSSSCGRPTACYFLVIFVFFASVSAVDHLQVAYEWKQLDFNYPSQEVRDEAIRSGDFVQANNVPVGLEVYEDRLFVTVPRWKPGVAASLAYIKLTDDKSSPKLNPYPNWAAHKQSTEGGESPEIVSPFRVRADKCGRLWVLDTGITDILGNFTVVRPTELIIYNLQNDELIHRYRIPAEQIKEDSFFANIAVEDEVCDNAFAYLGDLGKPGLVVYSWKSDSSWRVKHHYFHPDPIQGEFNVNGIKFQWPDGLFGLALSAAGNDGYSTLYFHPLSSTNEFSVSTKYLRNETLAAKSFHEFKVLGTRGPNGQSSVSFLDKNSGVLFYAMVNLNAIICWRTSTPLYTFQSHGRVFMNNVTMVFPNDIKVDTNGNIWVLSDRLPNFMYSELDPNDVNFRIFSQTVKDAIRGTACDSKLIVPSVSVKAGVPPKENNTMNSSGNTGFTATLPLILSCFIVMIAKK